MRTATVFRRNTNLNITVPWAVTRDSRGTVFGQPLRRNNCGCQGVSIDNCHEHTVEVVPATFHTVFLPKLSEGTLAVG